MKDDKKTKKQLVQELQEARRQLAELGKVDTRREEVEEALRENTERLLKAQRVSGMGFLDWNLKADEIILSDEAAHIYGLQPGGRWLTSELVARVVHPEDLETVRKNLDLAVRGEGSYDIDHRVVHPDGKIRWVHAQAELARDEQGNPATLLGTVVDITERKQAEEERGKTLAEKAAILDAMSDAVVMCDLSGNIISYNKAAEETWARDGFDAKDFIGKPGPNLPTVRLEDTEGYARMSDEIMKRGVIGPFERCTTTGRWESIVASFLKDNNGTPRALCGVIRDITEHKQVEQALRESEERFRALTEHALDGISIVDTDGTTLYESASLERILGHKAVSQIRGNVFDLVHPEDLTLAEETFRSVLANPSETLTVVLRNRDAEGSWHWMECTGSNLLDNPAVGGVVINYHDITERRQAEQELKESEQRFRRLSEVAEEGIVIHDKGVIVEGNEAFARLTGYELPELIGMGIDRLAAPECLEGIREIIATGYDQPYQAMGLRKDGSRIHLRLLAKPCQYHGKSLRVATFIDITEQERAREELRKHRDHLEELVEERTTELQARTSELEQANAQLQESDRLKSIFLASMSHELRTPLNSIIGFTGIILQGMAGEINAEQRRQLTMVKSSASHLLDLINDLLDVSRVEAGRVDLWLEEFSLDDAVREVAEMCLPMANEKGLDFCTEVPEDITLFSDRRRVKQILMNFASNAIKFSERGNIKITVKVLEGEKLEMCVADTGIGIEKDNMDRLFKPFQQVDMSLPKRYGGSGLGLYLSKKLADLLGGDVWVNSQYEVGSEFAVILPLKHGGGRGSGEEEYTSG